MVECARRILDEWNLQPEDTHLVSGGAAWSDHVAVVLYLEGRAQDLTLFVPAPFVGLGLGFRDTGNWDWRSNPGKTSNYYHKSFSKTTNRDSFRELESARLRGANFDSSRSGFHQRNTEIARNSDVMIAFSWSDSEQPEDGGTADTWSKFRGEKRRHVPLFTLANQ